MPADPGRETYTALMAPAFTEVFAGDIPQLVARPTERAIKVVECQMVAKALLDHVAWEASGLADHPFRRPDADNPEEIPEFLTPREYANRLLRFAFGDAEVLIKYAGRFLVSSQLDHIAHEAALARSKSLLLLARLDEKSKQAVVNSMTFSEMRSHMSDVPHYEGEAFQLAATRNGEPLVEWHNLN